MNIIRIIHFASQLMPSKNKLRVFYGCTRINRVRNKEVISIIYENHKQPEDNQTDVKKVSF